MMTIKVSSLENNTVNEQGDQAILPAGEYFVGDNGYLARANSDAWAEWVRITRLMSEDFTKPISGARYNDFSLVSANTAYGDGIYTDSLGNKYSVDAGMIGLTPVELLEDLEINKNKFAKLGAFITFDDVVTMNYKNKTIYIESSNVRIEIPTGG